MNHGFSYAKAGVMFKLKFQVGCFKISVVKVGNQFTTTICKGVEK